MITDVQKGIVLIKVSLLSLSVAKKIFVIVSKINSKVQGLLVCLILKSKVQIKGLSCIP